MLFEKRLELADRLDTNPPSRQSMDIRTTHDDAVKYELVNLPRYLAWNTQSFCHHCRSQSQSQLQAEQYGYRVIVRAQML